MTMVWIGIGLLAIGYLLLTFTGVSPEDYRKGKEYTAGDGIGGFLLIVGIIVLFACGAWKLASYIWDKSIRLFYGANANYAHMSFWDACAHACVAAAVFFFLALLAELRAESEYQKWRHRDFAKARRIRGQMKSYVNIHYRSGMFVLFVTFGCVIARAL